MPKQYLTDEQVEKEIALLSASETVRLARREQRLRYKRRQQLYTLRALDKRGAELQELGVTIDNIDAMIDDCELDRIFGKE